MLNEFDKIKIEKEVIMRVKDKDLAGSLQTLVNMTRQVIEMEWLNNKQGREFCLNTLEKVEIMLLAIREKYQITLAESKTSDPKNKRQ